MKTFLSFAFLALMALAFTGDAQKPDYILVEEDPKPCALCFDMQCMNSSICGGSGCVCFKKGMDLWGYCGSID